MKYGIALFPSKKLQDLANSYRKRYDPHYALVPPHLTLKTEFEASDENLKKITQEIRKTAQDANPLKISIKKFSSFSPVNNVNRSARRRRRPTSRRRRPGTPARRT